jgi:hypothetical protein
MCFILSRSGLVFGQIRKTCCGVAFKYITYLGGFISNQPMIFLSSASVIIPGCRKEYGVGFAPSENEYSNGKYG